MEGLIKSYSTYIFYCHFLTGVCVKTPPLFCFQQGIGSSFIYNAFWKGYGLLTKDVTGFEQSGHESVFYLYFSKTARKTSFKVL